MSPALPPPCPLLPATTLLVFAFLYSPSILLLFFFFLSFPASLLQVSPVCVGLAASDARNQE